MNANEKKISFLNKYFVFKKVRQVDTKAVFTELINKTSEDEAIDIESTILAQQQLEKEQVKTETLQSLSKKKEEKSTKDEPEPQSELLKDPPKKTVKKLSIKSTKKSVTQESSSAPLPEIKETEKIDPNTIKISEKVEEEIEPTLLKKEPTELKKEEESSKPKTKTKITVKSKSVKKTST
jgi:hypothetical protein